MSIRGIGEWLGILEPPDEATEQVRAEALEAVKEAHGEINRSRNMRGVPSVEYDLLIRGHKQHAPRGTK